MEVGVLGDFFPVFCGIVSETIGTVIFRGSCRYVCALTGDGMEFSRC
jgi:hypothetical protein